MNLIFAFAHRAIITSLSKVQIEQTNGLVALLGISPYVASKHAVIGLTRCLRLLERQFFLDDFDSLSAEAQRQVTDLVAGLKASGVITPTQIDAK